MAQGAVDDEDISSRLADVKLSSQTRSPPSKGLEVDTTRHPSNGSNGEPSTPKSPPPRLPVKSPLRQRSTQSLKSRPLEPDILQVIEELSQEVSGVLNRIYGK